MTPCALPPSDGPWPWPRLSTPSLPVQGRAESFPVGRVFCMGRNYPWGDAPSVGRGDPPAWFMKPADTVWLAQGVMPYPPLTQAFCHEVELVVAVGRGGRCLRPEAIEAHHILGYGVGLDLTRRDHQRHAQAGGLPWEAGKVFDQSAPCSPLWPATTVGHPRSGRIWLQVNGQLRQSADLSDQRWAVPELLAHLSQALTLRPGDLVFTGTPVGVDLLWPGDVVEAGIEGLGELRLQVGPQWAADAAGPKDG